MITLCKTACFEAGARDLPDVLRRAGFEVAMELCLDRCMHCERGEVVGKVDGSLVAQTPEEWRMLKP